MVFISCSARFCPTRPRLSDNIDEICRRLDSVAQSAANYSIGSEFSLVLEYT